MGRGGTSFAAALMRRCPLDAILPADFETSVLSSFPTLTPRALCQACTQFGCLHRWSFGPGIPLRATSCAARQMRHKRCVFPASELSPHPGRFRALAWLSRASAFAGPQPCRGVASRRPGRSRREIAVGEDPHAVPHHLADLRACALAAWRDTAATALARG
jgi:hypothetical protein